jgi:glutamyl-tRNA(Gln) amidotransferase subunit E
LREEFIDVSSIFKETKCKVLQKAISQGKSVLAAKLPKFAGLLGFELIPGLRFGGELSDRAKFWGRVGGILHTDELRFYGVSDEEFTELMRRMDASEEDAVVLVADKIENAEDALRAVVERVREALKGVPEETRAANPDGTTRYMRPRPGAARMYPETDVPPVKISEDYIDRLRARLPEFPEEKVRRLMRDYGINEKLARQLLDAEYDDLFETIVKETGIASTFVASMLTETFKALKREGVNINALTDEQIIGTFRLVAQEKTSKEAVPEIIKWLSKHEGAKPMDALRELGLTMITEDDLRKVVDTYIERNMNVVLERGIGALNILMGMIMRDFRGRAKPEAVDKILREKIKNVLVSKEG